MTSGKEISIKCRQLLEELPENISLVAAGKTRSPNQLQAAIDGGIKIIGHNYVQEAENSIKALGRQVKWHLIGHLQRNKAQKAVDLFDMIETVDNIKLGKAIEKACAKKNRVMPILVEINSANEPSKSGVSFDSAEDLIRQLAQLDHLKVEGLMTMGKLSAEPDEYRQYFSQTKNLFEQIKKLSIPNVSMQHLSMGMSDSYKVAIEEGATMIRIGSYLFGPR
jgi:pyridoxal phosphate enzyme (YggS family)